MGYSESAWQNMLGGTIHSLDGRSLEFVRLGPRIRTTAEDRVCGGSSRGITSRFQPSQHFGKRIS
jgi:hypothetical protein